MKKFILPLLTMAFLSACTAQEPAPPVVPPAEESAASQATQPQPTPPRTITLLSPDGETIEILAEIADEPEARTRGLMSRDVLAEDSGMLFIFGSSQPLTFWMKNTLIPLDVLYFDSEGAFVSSATMEPCAADPCATYPSAGPAMFALEVSAGFVERENVQAGWKLLSE